MPKTIRLALMLVALAVIYFIAARLSLTLAFAGSNASPIWPPAGIAIAALALGGLRLAPAITIAAFVANLLSFHDQSPQLAQAHWLAAALIALGNTGAALFAAAILRRTPDLPNLFCTQPAIYRFIATAMAACVVSAGVGTSTLSATGIIPSAIFSTVAWTWWLGDLTGTLLLTPLILAWARRDPLPAGAAPRWLGLLVVSALIAHTVFASGWLTEDWQRLLTFLLFPVVLWAAMREGLRLASVCVTVIAACAIAGTTRNLGPFAGNSLNDSLILLDTFVLLTATMTLVAAADRAERRKQGMEDSATASRLPYGVLLATLAITVAAWHLLANITQNTAQLRFDSETGRTHRQLERRLTEYGRVLRSATGLFAVSEKVDRNAWRDYVAQLNIQQDLPGIQGIGYVAQVPRSQRDALIAQVRREGFPDFVIRPPGERPIYTSIIYLEPFDRRNQRAFGYDMATEPTRRAAIERARDSGNPAISGQVTLLQEDGQDEQAGFLMYTPVYRRGVPSQTAEERRVAIAGYVYSPFRMGDLMRHVLGSQSEEIYIEVFDGPAADATPPMFTNKPRGEQRPTDFSTIKTLDLMGHTWTVRQTASPLFEAQINHSQDSFVFFAGALISLLAFGMTRSQSLVTIRAEKLAKDMTVDLQAAKNLLSEREQFSQLLFEMAPEAMMLSETTGRIVRVNQAACSTFGMTAAALTSLTVEDLMPARYRQHHQQLRGEFKRQMASLMGSGRELFAQRANGEEFPAEIALAPFQHAGQNYTLISLVDITERRAAETRLATLSALNSAILDNAAVSIISTDLDGTITSFNYGAEHLLGYRASEMVGKQTPAILHDPQEVLARADEFSRELGEAIAPGFEVFVAKSRRNLPNIHEWTYIHKSGRRTPVLLSVTALRDEKENIVGFLGVATDMSERHAAQTALEAKENFLRTVTDNIPGLVAYCDADMRIMFANRAYRASYGDENREIIGKTLAEIMEPALFAHTLPYVHSALAGKPQLFERPLRHPDGSTGSAMTHYIPDLEQGTVRGFFMLATDITELKRIQTDLEARTGEAEAANRAKSDFLANMSHEIRTPMNAVIGLSQLLADTPLDQRQRDYIDKIQGASKGLLDILNAILDYSKIEAGRMMLEELEFNVDELLDRAADLFALKAREKRVELCFERRAGLPRRLCGDPLRLGQVLTNLLSNAIKFTDQGEIHVTLGGQPKGDDVYLLELSVRDTGIGLTREQAERLFTAFEQADTSTTRKYGGTGLGLSICRQIVELMGGTIRLESEPGRGTTFFVEVPLAVAPGTTNPPPGLPANFTALVVTGHATSRLALVHTLEGLGCHAEAVSNAAEALSAARGTTPVRLLLLDARLPEYDIQAIARQFAAGESPPAIVLIGDGESEAGSAKTTDLPLAGVLQKPLLPSQLRATLQALASGQALTADTEAKGSDKRSPIAGARVLLVEDNATNQLVARELLRRMGVHCEIASNGAEALEKVQQADYDAVLMDLQMPEMDGFEATRAMRAMPECAKLPIIAMTAAALVSDQQASQAAGMNDHVAKPIDAAVLAATLAKWIPPLSGRALPAETPRPTSAAFSLPGLDLNHAVQRTQGDWNSLRRVLQSFAEDFRHAAQTLDACLADGDFGQAGRLVHTIKGLALNVGASKLQTLARQFESELQDGTAHSRSAFENALAATLAAIAELPDAPAAVTTAGSTAPDWNKLKPQFTELATMLTRRQGKARTQAVQLAQALAGSTLQEEFATLHRMIDKLQFSAAETALTALLAKHAPTSPESPNAD